MVSVVIEIKECKFLVEVFIILYNFYQQYLVILMQMDFCIGLDLFFFRDVIEKNWVKIIDNIGRIKDEEMSG